MVVKKANEWLKEKYSDRQKSQIVEIKLEKGTELEGDLVIEGFKILETIEVGSAKKITSFEVEDCPNIIKVDVSDNSLTKLDVSNLPNLDTLSFNRNDITELDTTGSENIRRISSHNNPPLNNWIGLTKNTVLSMWSGGIGNDSNPLPINLIIKSGLAPLASAFGIDKEELDGKTPEQIRDIIKEKTNDYINDNSVRRNMYNAIKAEIINNEGEETWYDLEKAAKIADYEKKLRVKDSEAASTSESLSSGVEIPPKSPKW